MSVGRDNREFIIVPFREVHIVANNNNIITVYGIIKELVPSRKPLYGPMEGLNSVPHPRWQIL